MSADKQTEPTQLPLTDNGLDKSTEAHPTSVTSRSRLYLIPLFMLTLFSDAVIGMYFQPPGLQLFFNARG